MWRNVKYSISPNEIAMREWENEQIRKPKFN